MWMNWSCRLWCGSPYLVRWAPWWLGFLFWVSCAGFGTRFWSGVRLGTAREPFRSVASSSGSDWCGIPFPIPASGSGCRSDVLDASVHWHLQINSKWQINSRLNSQDTQRDKAQHLDSGTVYQLTQATESWTGRFFGCCWRFVSILSGSWQPPIFNRRFLCYLPFPVFSFFILLWARKKEKKVTQKSPLATSSSFKKENQQ